MSPAKKNALIWPAIPALLISVVIVFIPGILTILTSFTNFNGQSLNMNFIGLKNYRELLGDSIFIKAFTNNIRWSVIYLIVPITISILIAYLLCRHQRGRNVIQALFLIPYVMASVINSVIWGTAIFSPVSGLFGVLHISSPLSNMGTALYAVAAVDIWHYWGFLLIIFLAAFRQTPQDQVEAALMDGCNGWQLFRYVYLPSILPTFKIMAAMVLIFSFQSFDYIWLITQGGPANASEMLSTYSYRLAFSLFNFGKAAAVALFICLIGLGVSIVYVHMSNQEDRA